MLFSRRFSVPGVEFGGVKFVERDSRIKTTTGATVFEHAGILVPEPWSQTAVDILAQKYMRKAGVPSEVEAVQEAGVPDWLRRRVAASFTGRDAALTYGRERDARQVFRRLAGAWTYEAWHHGYFGKIIDNVPETRRVAEANALTFYDELCAMLALQVFAPNSPQWFNTGLWWAYGIEAEGQELFKVREQLASLDVDAQAEDVTKISESYRHPMSYACFIQSVDDCLTGDGGIMSLAHREAKVFKFGGGSGSNFSDLRAEGEPLTAGGQSSGLMSWLGGYDRFAGAIKSGGTTRRAAKMIIVDDDHPDLLAYINWKVREEDKVAMLAAGSVLVGNYAAAIASAVKDGPDLDKNPKLKSAVAKALRAGVPGPYVRRVLGLARSGRAVDVPVYDTDWQGEAYRTVGGQNANNTVRVTNEFMSKCLTDEPHHLYWRTEKEKAKSEQRKPKPCKTLRAREVWDAIVDAAWKSADPGIHFAGTVAEWNTVANDGEIRATNPCSEFIFLDNTGCNLASVNLVTFIRPDGTFDWAAYAHACRLVTVVLDVTVDMSSYPSPEIAKNAHNYRTLGLGYCNIGGLLMRCGIPYDSEQGRRICAAVTCLMHSEALCTSAQLAHELGTFPRFHANRDHTLRVLHNHAALANPSMQTEGLSRDHYKLDWRDLPGEWRECGEYACDRAKEALRFAGAYGVRNAQVTNLAPTGTIGPLMDADTTGIEPDFALVKFKSLAGGGYFKMVNQGVPAALKTLGYSAEEIEDVRRYINGTGWLFNGPTECPHLDKLVAHYGAAQISEFSGKVSSAVDVSHVITDVDKVLTSAELTELNRYVCGHMTIEGAPHVKDEHLPVFDTANKCGTGSRFLAWQAHVDMLCAAQSWISGGISKTINLPAEATQYEMSEAYLRSWHKGGKCISLYRDESKLSQPLSSGDSLSELTTVSDVEEIKQAERIVTKIITTRRMMPPRRGGYTQKARVGPHKLYLRTGEYDDGTLGEIFVDLYKEGASFRSLMGCFCIAVSLGLQHGVPLDEFVDKFTFQRFEPYGPVQHHDRLKNCTSIVDFIFRDLAITYLGRDDLAHVPAADMPAPLDAASEDADRAAEVKANRPQSAHVKVPSAQRAKIADSREQSRRMGYTGNFCTNCGSNRMVRCGACERCEECHETGGCS